MENIEAIKKSLCDLCEVYGQKYTENVESIHIEALSEYGGEIIIEAKKSWIKYQRRMAYPSDLVRICKILSRTFEDYLKTSYFSSDKEISELTEEEIQEEKRSKEWLDTHAIEQER